jgi:hypothetical protein
VAGVLYLFDPKARIEILQSSRSFIGNNGSIPNDKQDRDANCTHQLTILRIGRRKNLQFSDSEC